MIKPIQHDPYGKLVEPATLVIERVLPGPIERVWQYLTNSRLRSQWLASGDMPATVDKEFELTWRNDELTQPPGNKPEGFGTEHRMQSRILTFDAPRKLCFTWGGGDVCFDLAEKGSMVVLTVTHRGLPDRNMTLMVGAGWHMHLDILLARVSGTTSEPFWEGWVRLKNEYDQRLP